MLTLKIEVQYEPNNATIPLAFGPATFQFRITRYLTTVYPNIVFEEISLLLKARGGVFNNNCSRQVRKCHLLQKIEWNSLF